MIEIIDKNKCCGCHACYNICPKDAIIMEEDEKGFKYPKIDSDKCINCGLCKKSCPIINEAKNNNEPEAWAMYNNELSDRVNSSSGGIFMLLAKEIIKRKGVVFGAMFDSNFNVIHSCITSISDIEKLQGSKYVQSSIMDSYMKVKEYLDEDRYVLFTGTSCQIEGLNHYLVKKYDKLYTQDIICHGVPSPKVWREYLKYQKNNNKETIRNVSFRNKDYGWSLFRTKVWFDTKTYSEEHSKDIYMKSFLRNLCLRDSCYNCKFKNKYRNSDITLADFWGANNVCPEMNDDKGLSLVLINSKKGLELFETIKNNCTIKKVDFEKAIKYNSAYYQSCIMPKNREIFFKEINSMNFEKTVNKYTRKPLIKRVFGKIKKIIKMR